MILFHRGGAETQFIGWIHLRLCVSAVYHSSKHKLTHTC
jgi:hypothetical protein